MQGRNQGAGFVQHNGIACGADHSIRMLHKSFADLLLRVTLHTTLCAFLYIVLHTDRCIALYAVLHTTLCAVLHTDLHTV